jgi:hypothetical protein
LTQQLPEQAEPFSMTHLRHQGGEVNNLNACKIFSMDAKSGDGQAWFC